MLESHQTFTIGDTAIRAPFEGTFYRPARPGCQRSEAPQVAIAGPGIAAVTRPGGATRLLRKDAAESGLAWARDRTCSQALSRRRAWLLVL